MPQDPKIGDMVLLSNGYRAEVVDLGSVATNGGLATTYHVRYLEGHVGGMSCLREQFTFPIPTDLR